jgi:hypothetical protein
VRNGRFAVRTLSVLFRVGLRKIAEFGGSSVGSQSRCATGLRYTPFASRGVASTAAVDLSSPSLQKAWPCV